MLNSNLPGFCQVSGVLPAFKVGFPVGPVDWLVTDHAHSTSRSNRLQDLSVLFPRQMCLHQAMPNERKNQSGLCQASDPSGVCESPLAQTSHTCSRKNRNLRKDQAMPVLTCQYFKVR